MCDRKHRNHFVFYLFMLLVAFQQSNCKYIIDNEVTTYIFGLFSLSPSSPDPPPARSSS